MRVLSELHGAVSEGYVDEGFAAQLSDARALMALCLEFEDVVLGNKKVSTTSRDPRDIERRLVNAKIHVITELADTFAWLCSVLNKVWLIATTNDAWRPLEDDAVPQSQKVGIREAPSGKMMSAIEYAIIEEYYEDADDSNPPRCPTCKAETKCACVFAFGKEPGGTAT